MKFATLNNNVKMPLLGFGTMNVDNLEEMIPKAAKAGYRLFDTAANYDNEEAVGAGLKNSGLKRADYFVTSKVKIQKNGYEGTLKAFDETMQKLGLDYLDLYLIHQPYGDLYGEWRALEKLYADGKVRAIGVSNFEPFQLVDISYYSEIKPMVNQVELHPYLQQTKQRQFMKDFGTQVQAWSPFAHGTSKELFNEKSLTAIAAKYGKSVQQVILNWMMANDIAAIPQSNNDEHMRSNFDIFDFSLTEQEIEQINKLDQEKTVMLDHLDAKATKFLMGVN